MIDRYRRICLISLICGAFVVSNALCVACILIFNFINRIYFTVNFSSDLLCSLQTANAMEPFINFSHNHTLAHPHYTGARVYTNLAAEISSGVLLVFYFPLEFADKAIAASANNNRLFYLSQ